MHAIFHTTACLRPVLVCSYGAPILGQATFTNLYRQLAVVWPLITEAVGSCGSLVTFVVGSTLFTVFLLGIGGTGDVLGCPIRLCFKVSFLILSFSLKRREIMVDNKELSHLINLMSTEKGQIQD